MSQTASRNVEDATSQENEVTTTYTYGGATHTIRLLDRVSPEIMLLHGAKMGGFHRVVKEGSPEPTARGIRRALSLGGR